MNFAAKLVVKKNHRNAPGSRYSAGFASKITGVEVEDFGKWFGSQMSYRPFASAKKRAEKMADELNAADLLA